jgi:hypothetical protein
VNEYDGPSGAEIFGALPGQGTVALKRGGAVGAHRAPFDGLATAETTLGHRVILSAA